MSKGIFFLGLFVFLLFAPQRIFAQGGVVISQNSDAQADPSAILDIQSDSLGVLIPRITTEQMNRKQVKANGLLIYNKDDNHFYYYDGQQWQRINQWKYDATTKEVFYDSGGDTLIDINDSITINNSKLYMNNSVLKLNALPTWSSYHWRPVIQTALSSAWLTYTKSSYTDTYLGIGITHGGWFFISGLPDQTPQYLFYVSTNGVEKILSHIYPMYDNTAYLGASGYRWKAVYAVNGTIQTSDERDKKDIKSLDYGLKQVMQLKPVSYYWKDDSVFKGRKLGFVAQDMQKIIPEVVVPPQGKDGHYGIIYTDLIPVLTKAIQEQQKQIDKQNKQIEIQSQQITLLQQQINQLKKQNQRLMQLLKNRAAH